MSVGYILSAPLFLVALLGAPLDSTVSCLFGFLVCAARVLIANFSVLSEKKCTTIH